MLQPRLSDQQIYCLLILEVTHGSLIFRPFVLHNPKNIFEFVWKVHHRINPGMHRLCTIVNCYINDNSPVVDQNASSTNGIRIPNTQLINIPFMACRHVMCAYPTMNGCRSLRMNTKKWSLSLAISEYFLITVVIMFNILSRIQKNHCHFADDVSNAFSWNKIYEFRL